MTDLPKIYEPQKHEDLIYQKWEQSGFFNPNKLPAKKGRSFSMVLPPPNVTGQLHIGHATMLSYQDILARFHRLKGEKTLWLPGMDHAAIATQNVVEKELRKKGLSRHQLGRDKFLQAVSEFAEKSKVIIRNQLKKMGSSLDWSREKFTLDKDLSLAVKTAFKKMYDDGLIYRGNRVVNWCPRCQSTLADDEVEYEETKGKLYFIKYGPLTVATTRPETKLGDTGVAVNPKDKRYQKFVGQELNVDLAGHQIKVKIFADRAVDMNFGTGAIGVTPAHSQQDFLWAEKYQLPVIQVINEEGKMTEKAGKYQGLATKDCREQFVRDLQKVGLIEKVEDYTNNLSICYRCGTAVEPLTSKQWFVAVNKKIPWRFKTLKQLAVEAVKKGEIKIIPEHFNKTYFQWMDNLRDWCISRQIWYGHRIPVWYKNNSKLKTPAYAKASAGKQNSKLKEEIYVGVEPPKGEGWIQDEDTLDTWFSSALWTFSTLGWPKKTKDLKQFHPTSVMETGYDILFFWVARMILMSEYLLKEKPFETVYLHGLVRTKTGEKMSKSKPETCIDPLEMIQKYGADALRLSMTSGATPGNDIRLYEEKIAGYRNFVNKLWNISRYILASVKEIKSINHNPRPVTLADQWILAELDQIIALTTKNIEEFRFSAAGEQLYEFTWSKLADWYLEIAKIEKDKDEILLYILERLLILWHPFCPFVTEVIWEKFGTGELLMVREWPESKEAKNLPAMATPKAWQAGQKSKKAKKQDFTLIQEIVTAIRNARAEHGAELKKVYNCSIISSQPKIMEENQLIIEGLAKVKILPKLDQGVPIHNAGFEIILAIDENQDLAKNRLKEIENLEHYLKLQEVKLKNKEFLKKAPPAVVEQEKAKLAQAEDKLAKLK